MSDRHSVRHELFVLRKLPGQAMEEWNVSLLISAVLVFVFVWCTRTSKGMAIVAGVSFILSMLSLPFSVRLSFHLALTWVVSIATLSDRSKGFRVGLLMMAPVLPYLWQFDFGEYREAMEIRRSYPIVSLAPRLQYEVRQAKSDLETSDLHLSERVATRLTKVESRQPDDFVRLYSLHRAHEVSQVQFLLEAGFGVGRILRVRRQFVDLPEFSPIPYDPIPVTEPRRFDATGSALNPIEQKSSSDRFTSVNMRDLYETSFSDFLEPSRMGMVDDAHRVAGFLPHRFTQMPGTIPDKWWVRHRGDFVRPEKPAREWHRRRWAIVRLELVGILKHDRPVAYVSEQLPELEELSTYPTRELSEFERNALEQLREQEDIVVDNRPERILMVGSLRAGDDCRKCHSVRRGELLGALTYELRPE